MKKVVLFLLIIQSCFFYAQEEERPKPIKFSASDRCGIIYYEVDELTESINVKNEDLFYDVSKAVRKYNNKVKEVAFLNFKSFKELDQMINTALNRDPSVKVDLEEQKKKQEESKHLMTVLPEARKKIRSFNIELDTSLKEVLSKKQYKKWGKYRKKKIKTLMPEKPRAPDNGKTSRSGFGDGGGLGQQRQQGGRFR